MGPLVSTAGLRSISMIPATVVPETIENVIPPTGSACPVRMTVDAVLDTLNVACAQAVGLPARTLTANNRTRINRRILGMDIASSAAGPALRDGIPYRRVVVVPPLWGGIRMDCS